MRPRDLPCVYIHIYVHDCIFSFVRTAKYIVLPWFERVQEKACENQQSVDFSFLPAQPLDAQCTRHM